MGPGIFLIAIMGCGEGDAPCQQVRLLDTHYQSRAECVAATESALLGNSDADFPTIVAQCVDGRQAASLRVMAGEVRVPDAPGWVATVPTRIASRQ
ncbi:MAG: hypothetical protein JWP15_3806 [Alphaproteobacteria bacterium]|nr:hypothetical protein [Alphaproteobacteria bacterium]